MSAEAEPKKRTKPAFVPRFAGNFGEAKAEGVGLGVARRKQGRIASRYTLNLKTYAQEGHKFLERRGWDSNPQVPKRDAGFQDQFLSQFGAPLQFVLASLIYHNFS